MLGNGAPLFASLACLYAGPGLSENIFDGTDLKKNKMQLVYKTHFSLYKLIISEEALNRIAPVN